MGVRGTPSRGSVPCRRWGGRSHRRYGTLWAERFKSVLIEDTAACLRTVAAYIDLNPVRAGLVEDPKNYRFCGYAEGVAGNVLARAGLGSVLQENSSRKLLAEYRKILFLMGSTTSRESQLAMDREKVKRVLEEDGELPLGQILRLKVRYFTDGMVLGSQSFVDKIFEGNQDMFGKRRRTGARPMRGLKGTGLTVMRDLRKQVFT